MTTAPLINFFMVMIVLLLISMIIQNTIKWFKEKRRQKNDGNSRTLRDAAE